MTIFLRLINAKDKEAALKEAVFGIRSSIASDEIYDLNEEKLEEIPGSPFAYWVSDQVRKLFRSGVSKNFIFKPGIASGDDFRFLRSWWEISFGGHKFIPIAKGGAFSPFYQDLDLVLNWGVSGEEFLSFDKCQPRNIAFFMRPGITWPFRTAKGLNTRVLPSGCGFTIQGMAGFDEKNELLEVLFLAGVTNSIVFKQLLLLSVGAFAFQAGTMSSVPIPHTDVIAKTAISNSVREIWKKKYVLDTTNETSHAFLMPSALARVDREKLNEDIDDLLQELNDSVFMFYNLAGSDRDAIEKLEKDFIGTTDPDTAVQNEETDEDWSLDVKTIDALLSWAAGVAFGRFDWRLAAGEREAPPEPEPFDPLPTKSPGMLPDDAKPFHSHSGILVDDQGHPNDITHLIEEVLARVQVDVPGDVRRWLRHDFFPLHLKQYSKSRRKAPIYWPISTTSGSYSLWLYYSSLTDQTLFTAVNDFIEPKLKQVGQDVAALRTKGSARSRDDEKSFEVLQALELELIELRNTLLEIAQTYRPNHDDGVQITAAPLWQLFRHKPWQKILKDTWAKLEEGDYDWAYLAMAYWPDRVSEKCKTDKSLAIAHDLENLYEEPEIAPGAKRGRKTTVGDT